MPPDRSDHTAPSPGPQKPIDAGSARIARIRQSILGATVLLGLGLVGWQYDVHQPVLTALHRTDPPRAPTLVFVVLDTVRADHLSACGYARPTSPTLERLVHAGASLTCAAEAPGAWTLPSHASFFTGLPVSIHGSDRVPADATAEVHSESVDVFGMGERTRPLAEHFPTLAEQLSERGYQTAAVSANLVVSDTTGLLRGFDHRRAAGAIQWRGDTLVAAVRDTLRDVERDGTPLFLFVNIIDAHQPFASVPSGLDWVEPQDAIFYHLGSDDDPFAGFVSGRIQGEARADLQRRITNGYDWGVHNADATLAGVLDTLDAHGWMDEYRLVVTSDHGEFLGEHGLLDHGVYLYEPLTNVPLLVAEHPVRERDESPGWPRRHDRISATESYSFVLDGRRAGYDVLASAQPNAAWLRLSDGRVGAGTRAAWWTPDTKWLATDDATTRISLDVDGVLPREPGPPADRPTLLADHLEQLSATMSAPVEPNDEITEMLIQAGYLDP